MFHRLKKIIRHGDGGFSGCSLKTRPFAQQDRKRRESPLWMV
jgi:hypothetical protein